MLTCGRAAASIGGVTMAFEPQKQIGNMQSCARSARRDQSRLSAQRSICRARRRDQGVPLEEHADPVGRAHGAQGVPDGIGRDVARNHFFEDSQ